jgi:hypothetical protein
VVAVVLFVVVAMHLRGPGLFRTVVGFGRRPLAIPPRNHSATTITSAMYS